ncbi:MAG: uroporphyrinogen-III C-methyltransferase [Gammaproteobacteria bacterium]|nr:uroporphyrinogen-III C-methyltransferase [Gammaproteobacteria bacterium]
MTENEQKKTASKKTTSKKTGGGKSLVSSTAMSGQNQKKILIILSSVTGLLVLAVVYLFFIINSHSAKNIQHQLQASAGLVNLEQQITEIESGLTAVRSGIDSLASTQQGLTDALQALQKERPDSEQDWTLREVEYLVTIAMHRLQLERDTVTAIAALQLADQRVNDLGNPALLSLREQLNSDINALKTLNQPDITAMVAWLTDMQERISSLPLNTLVSEQTLAVTTAEDPADPESTLAGWRQLPAMIWNELKSLVVIKHKSESGSAFILPQEEYYLMQNMKLELANARLAVLRRDTGTLHASLALVEHWLRSYFDPGSTAVINTLESVGKMRTLDLRPPLPDINASLKAVHEFIRSG